MSAIPDFNDTELWVVRTTVNERYGREIEVQQAEAELRLDPGSTTLTPCPTLYWAERGAHFVISKIGDSRYRAQFFYRVHQQYGTGRDFYTDLGECVTTLLQVQADDERKRGLDAANNETA